MGFDPTEERREGLMTYTRVSARLAQFSRRLIRNTRFLALLLIAAFTSVAMQPAQAQSSDTWKSVAIIGGSTAVGAYVGHRVGGSTGAWVGAAAGASAGYAIDKRRRDNQYYNEANGDYGYYGNNDPYYGDGGGYYPGPADGGAYPYPYPSGYRSNNYTSNYVSGRRCSRH